MKGRIYKTSLIILLLAFGICGYIAMPNAMESAVPTVSTVRLTAEEYCESVSVSGIISEESDSWYVISPVNEADIPYIKIGQYASVSGAAIGSGKYAAEVTEIGGSARQQAGVAGVETVVDVKLKISNPDDGLKSGYTATARINTAESRTVHILPYSAIRQDEHGEFIYIVGENSTVKRQNIETGAELPYGAEIVSELPADAEIISEPEKVTENALVSVARAGSEEK